MKTVLFCTIWVLFKCIWDTDDLAYCLHACRAVYIITNLKAKNWSDETTPAASESHRSPDSRNGTHSSSSLVAGSGLGMWNKRSGCQLSATAVCAAGESCAFLSAPWLYLFCGSFLLPGVEKLWQAASPHSNSSHLILTEFLLPPLSLQFSNIPAHLQTRHQPNPPPPTFTTHFYQVVGWLPSSHGISMVRILPWEFPPWEIRNRGLCSGCPAVLAFHWAEVTAITFYITVFGNCNSARLPFSTWNLHLYTMLSLSEFSFSIFCLVWAW